MKSVYKCFCSCLSCSLHFSLMPYILRCLILICSDVIFDHLGSAFAVAVHAVPNSWTRTTDFLSVESGDHESSPPPKKKHPIPFQQVIIVLIKQTQSLSWQETRWDVKGGTLVGRRPQRNIVSPGKIILRPCNLQKMQQIAGKCLQGLLTFCCIVQSKGKTETQPSDFLLGMCEF